MQNIPLEESIEKTIPIILVETELFEDWFKKQTDHLKKWLSSNNFNAISGDFCLVPHSNGSLEKVIVGFCKNDFWIAGRLSKSLPLASYHIGELYGHISKVDSKEIKSNFVASWCLGAYTFKRYKSKSSIQVSKLVCPKETDLKYVKGLIHSSYITRDLINTPCEDLSPLDLANFSKSIADKHGADFKLVSGDDLISKNFPAIHAVGRASVNDPQLIEICKGDKTFPKLTLVGKGVCFDSGGLDLKPSSGMRLMKKDMGGAANVLGLANWILSVELPLQIRIIIPAVENLVSSNSFKPGDVIRTRKGTSVEIGNTDAEGRLILADALTYACEDSPDLLIDCATLTGSARSALGSDIPALFSNSDNLANELMDYGVKRFDPVWRLPLWKNYMRLIDSKIADINNAGESNFAGSITAALFLESFIKKEIPWIHLDMYCWNLESLPGRPAGGEAQSQRALFDLIVNRLC